MRDTTIRILLVEDNATNRTFLGLYLRRKGYTVEEACNGYEALNLLQEKKYDIVFMDVQMPGLDGVETTRIIRKNASGQYDSRIPIIAMTAYTMKNDKNYLLQSGMDYYVAKPIELEQLAVIAEKWAYSKKARNVIENCKNASCRSGKFDT